MPLSGFIRPLTPTDASDDRFGQALVDKNCIHRNHTDFQTVMALQAKKMFLDQFIDESKWSKCENFPNMKIDVLPEYTVQSN